MARIVAEYDVKADSRKRVVLRSSTYEYYRAREYEDGRVVLEPRELRAPTTLSRQTLIEMDEAMRNVMAGEAGDEFDLSEVQDLIDEP